jgi:hypothetical protein
VVHLKLLNSAGESNQSLGFPYLKVRVVVRVRVTVRVRGTVRVWVTG